MSPELAAEFAELLNLSPQFANHESNLGSGPIFGWLYSLERFGKEAYVRIAIALAHELLGRESTPKEHTSYLRSALWVAEDWAVHPDRRTLDIAIQAVSETQDFLIAHGLEGCEDPRASALAAVWAAAARQTFPPCWAAEEIESWQNEADDCALEGAAYACQIFHDSSSNVDELVTLMEIHAIIKAELCPWLLGKTDPISARVLHRQR